MPAPAALPRWLAWYDRWSRPLAWLGTAALITLLAVPIPPGPPETEGLPLDKVVHVVLFGGFVLAWWWTLRHQPRVFVWGLLIGLGTAFSTEAMQALLPWRSAEPYDLLADAAGVLLALLLSALPPLRHWGRPAAGADTMGGASRGAA
jgi:VanZ family protein